VSHLAPLVLSVILAAQPAPPVESDDYVLTQVGSGFSAPLYLTAPPGDPRLFIVEQGGRIRIIENGAVRSTPFLNVSPLITPARGAEQGLLGLAFHPDFPSNGRFFIAYTNTGGDLVVAEYHATPSSDVADPAVIRRLMTIDHPFSNHNGGMVMFGADDYLYVGSGDGGGGGDPFRTPTSYSARSCESTSMETTSRPTRHGITAFLRITRSSGPQGPTRCGFTGSGIPGASGSIRSPGAPTSPMSGSPNVKK